MIDLWYKDAVFYEIDVKTFQDSNGDGYGDFPGLIRRLPHITSLGVTCIWLQPFYPSPLKDDGYDVADFYNVDPRLGTLGDFVDFVRQARERGLRVLIDLVVNHSSDKHPWFQSARASPTSPYRDYYIWSKTKPEDAEQGVIFPGSQHTIWTYDTEAKQYYHHRFYEHQPDLNIANPVVRDEICKIMGFWLELGISGFRLDAAPFLGGSPEDEGDPSLQLFQHLEQFRQFLSWRSSSAIILAEANVSLKEVEKYFDHGPQLHMLFNFLMNQKIFLALAREEAEPIADLLQQLPSRKETGQWGNFLRNHDELSLDRLTEAEREEVFAIFAPEENMRAYGRGIRRRLAPMLNDDRRREELAYSLLFTLPGSPVLRYGDEIGMGEDLSLPERLTVRTPMQWSAEKNGGFSRADPERLIRPVVMTSDFGFERVNVATQDREQDSLMSKIQHLLHIRKKCPEIGWGSYRVLPGCHRSVLAHRCEWREGAFVAAHNLSSQAVQTSLSIEDGETLIELASDCRCQNVDDPTRIELAAYGYRWFRIQGEKWKFL
ncbi:alpha-amylase family protein [Anatilimnocola sp. NA78]|uniref:alpha-amylase family protein n=1 Tax=Anatilimnocola sp. NA78 TaxID=3415683 RepID=UPI003CE5231A